MRIFLLGLVGCGFSPTPGTTQVDAAFDGRDIDGPLHVTWAVDGTSGKAVPASTQEWSDLIAAHRLGIAPPSDIWSLQDSGVPLFDTAGTLNLTALNSSPASFLKPVAGWDRVAISTSLLGNTSFGSVSATLPDVSNTTMTVLVYFANITPSSTTRSILFGGAGGSSMYGEVSLDPMEHYAFSVGGTTATGTIDHGSGVVPIVLKLARGLVEEHLIVDHELIALPGFVPLQSSHGLLLAAAGHLAPEGRWLYMAAWFGPDGELTDSQIDAMQTALGW